MKRRNLFLILCATLLVAVGCEKPVEEFVPPTGDGLFSVSDSTKVRFSPGNLDYTEGEGYSFVEHQYYYGGYFGWGTGDHPMDTSSRWEDYPDFDDWGNHIEGVWRTLSEREWRYVIRDREEASNKRGTATVCGVYGLVLLPDNWSGGSFRSSFNEWSRNVYDASSWSEMETAGAVFLPAAGSRDGARMDNVGKAGHYWSSTSAHVSDNNPYDMYGGALPMNFNEILESSLFRERCDGLSVRLVQDINNWTQDGDE